MTRFGLLCSLRPKPHESNVLAAHVNTLAVLVSKQGPLLPADAVGWMVRLAKRVEAMHGSGRIHGNISPESITVDGASPRLQGILLDLLRTDPSYQSPERANGGSPSPLDDSWAIATTLFTLLTSRAPYQANGGGGDAAIKQAIMTQPAPRLAQFGVMDPVLNNIMLTALAPEPAKRFGTALALRQALEHWSADASIAQLPPLEEDEDENQPTMIRSALEDMPVSNASRPTAQAPLGAPFGEPHPAPFASPMPAAGVRPPMQIPGGEAGRAAPTMRFATDEMPPHLQQYNQQATGQNGFSQPGTTQGGLAQQPQVVGLPPPGPVPSRILALFFAVWFVVTVAGGVAIFFVLRK